MKTFYDFLLEAPTPPAAPAPSAATPPPPAAPGAGAGAGPTGSPPSPLGGLGPSLGSIGGGSPMPSPMGGGMGMGSEGMPQGSPQGKATVQKVKTLSVWDALEKSLGNKNGQNKNNMVKSS